MAPRNPAAWLTEIKDATHVVSKAPYNKPEADEIFIKTKAVAIDPADVRIQKTSILIDTYPAILGYDVAGLVEEVGSTITDFQPGDRVIGQAKPLPGGIYKYSGFQYHVVLNMPEIAKISADAKWTDATGINTAASCFFQETTLALQIPPSQSPSRRNTDHLGREQQRRLLCGVQLTTQAGYTVFGVASLKNDNFIQSLGTA